MKIFKKATALLVAVAVLGSSQTIAWASESFTSASEEELFSDGTEPGSEEEVQADIEVQSQESFSAAEEEYLPIIQTTRIPYGKAGEPYSIQLEAKGSGKITWSLGTKSTVPKGLMLSEAGVLSGTPTEYGNFLLYVQAGVGEARSVRKFTLHIKENLDLLPDYDVGPEKEITQDFGEIHGVNGRIESTYFYNRGTKPVHFKELPECRYFELSWTDGENILAGRSSILLEMRVKEALSPGIYEERVVIESEENISLILNLKVTIPPASQKEYDLFYSPNTVVFDKKFYDENFSSECSITVTNIGTKETSVHVQVEELENFTVTTEISEEEGEQPEILKPGESMVFNVKPLHYYGTYDTEIFYFTTNDGSKFPVQVSMNYEKPKAPLKITPYQVKFGDIYVNAKEAPDPSKVTIQNVTDETMQLELDPCESFRVGTLTRATLKPAESAEFKVWPKSALPVGTYMEAIRIRMIFDSGAEDDFLLDVRADVGDRLFAGAVPLEPIKNLQNGTEKTEKALGLPEYVKVYDKDKKTTFQAGVHWYLDESSYDPQKKEAQIFQVRGVLVLEPGENGNHLDTTVSMEVQVNAYQPIGIPVIKKARAVTNYASVTLGGKAEGAEGYQFVAVKSAEDLEKENFLSVMETDKLSANVKYIPKGKHILYCRGYRGKKDSLEYGAWSEGKEINVKYATPKAPAIDSYGWSNCDIRLSVRTPEKVDGYDVVVARSYNGTEPLDYALVKTGYSGTSEKIIIPGVPKGIYYVGIHSYRKKAGVKVLSRWSNLITIYVEKGLVKTAPVIKKTAVSRRTLTVQSAVPKGANGYDWVLAKKCVKNKNGTYKPSGYAYIQKNKRTGKILFKNIKPGTYYLTGHSYVKGFQKRFGNWAKPRKIVIK